MMAEILELNFDQKSSHSGESTQILGLLCLWQCLYFPLF